MFIKFLEDSTEKYFVFIIVGIPKGIGPTITFPFATSTVKSLGDGNP